MADWFVGPVMDRIIKACSDYLQDQFRWQTGTKEELERLRENHPKIQAVFSASSTQAHISDLNPALKDWIWLLRDAIDEADDLLDELDYMKLRKQLIKSKKRPKVRLAINFLKRAGQRALKSDPYLKRLTDVVQKLDKVSAEVGSFLHLVENAKQEQQKQEVELYKSRETGSLPKNDLIGRGEDMEFVMQWLRKPSNEDPTRITLYKNISLLSIVGHGGMGKTALLQHVYEDMKEEFDLKMWVCVSNSFEVKKIIADMLECLKMKKPDVESLDALQRSLKSEVMSKKFLLVLDDVWEEEQESDKSKWENVFSPLAYGSMGSKILVTTRMDSVGTVIAKVINKKKKTLRLKGLGDEESLQLLNTHTFADVENLDNHKQLRSIAREIVKTLSGSPLAIKVIGGVLSSSLNVSHWMRVLNSDIGSATLGQSNIMLILRLSYTFLPRPLQNCFTFCSIFPQSHNFIREDLIKMWISLDFIQAPSISGETMEDIGGKCFDILVKKSFFDNFEPYYKMHDLLHELAQSISAQECFRAVGDKEFPFRIPKTIRHLFVQTTNVQIMKKVRGLKKLRSIFFWCDTEDQDFIDVLTQIFKESTSIRLLFISSPSLRVIPEAIENLIHLRYLNISRNYVTQLPRSLSSLYHLQFIIYQSYLEIHSNDLLPRDINNLSNLRYMEMPQIVFSWIRGIRKLNSLQKLDAFYVKNEDGYRIGELEHMNELRVLNIKFLGSVKDVREACSAKLCAKRNLLELSLDWGHTELASQTPSNCVLHEQVLANLQPQNNLKKLCIRAYMGARSATWMDNANLISNLNSIHLDECLEWEILPPFGQLPLLKFLFLWNMPKAKRLNHNFQGEAKHCVFPSLQVLHIGKLDALEDLFDTAGAAEDEGFFPCLTELYLIDCPNLHQFPFLPPKLKTLTINNIGWKALNWRQGTSNCCSIPKIFPLRSLNICRCPNLSSLPLADEIVRLEALRNLTIENCSALDCLPSSLATLSSLQKLDIIKVPKLRELPDLPHSLECLTIKNCHQVLMERYEEPSGSDRHKIALIPNVYISR